MTPTKSEAKPTAYNPRRAVIAGCKATELFCDNGPRGSYFTRVLELEVLDGSHRIRHNIDLGRRAGAFATAVPNVEIIKTDDDNAWIDVAIVWGDGRSMQRRIDLVRGVVIDNPAPPSSESSHGLRIAAVSQPPSVSEHVL